MENNRVAIRQRIGRAMFMVAAVLLTVSLGIAALQSCQDHRVTGEPIINIQIG